MEDKNYSAGMVKLPFWFYELRKTVELLNQGKTLEDIKKLSLEENIFSASSQARAIQIFNTISLRVSAFDGNLLKFFEETDVVNQKLLTLISIMESDLLFFEFIYEVYREKLILGVEILVESDFSIFFKDKEVQSEIGRAHV